MLPLYFYKITTPVVWQKNKNQLNLLSIHQTFNRILVEHLEIYS